MKAIRLVLLALVGALTLVLSGCAQSADRAATVGDDVITNDDVDFLARMQCEALDKAKEQGATDPSQQPVQTVPTRQVRTQMVNALVQAELNRQFAEREDADYDRVTFRQVMDQFEPAVQQAAKEDRARFRDLVGSFYRGQLQVYAIAQDRMAQAGIANPTDEQVQEAIAALQDDFRRSVDIEINPVYGPGPGDIAGVEEPSLSLAVSEFAEQSSSPVPAQTWIERLPDTMTCG